MTVPASRSIGASLGPLHPNLGLPAAAALTAPGIRNASATTTPAILLAASMHESRRPRKVVIDNYSATETLAYTTRVNGSGTSLATMTATAAGAATNGIRIKPGEKSDPIIVPHNAELWLVSTAAGGSAYQMLLSENE